jgi:hypothetical protein
MVCGISEQQRVHVTVRTDQRQVGHTFEQGAGHSPLCTVAAEISIGSLRQMLA